LEFLLNNNMESRLNNVASATLLKEADSKRSNTDVDIADNDVTINVDAKADDNIGNGCHTCMFDKGNVLNGGVNLNCSHNTQDVDAKGERHVLIRPDVKNDVSIADESDSFIVIEQTGYGVTTSRQTADGRTNAAFRHRILHTACVCGSMFALV